MELVIFHYHLNRGGVTSVIENHLRSLATLSRQQQPTRVTIVYGGRHAAWNQQLADDLPFECSLEVVPQLEYDNFQTATADLYAGLQTVLDRFDRASTLLHIHNHSLGKNFQIASTVGRLANEGWRMLLQLHDFAEDLRPGNYRHLIDSAESLEQLQTELYPQAEQIHYSVLNQRDRGVLSDAKICPDRLHLLPNPVEAVGGTSRPDRVAAAKSELHHALEIPANHQLVLYPVRPIRRKNLGEFLLWSLLADDTTFALTLAPLNPEEMPAYRRWVDFATGLRLPVRFEIASKTDLAFAEVYAAADAIITTSVAEGFGLVYLEAALARKQLVGRNLPSVCQDFEAAGMEFPGLSKTMAIPTEAVDVMAAKRIHRECLEQLRDDYGLPTDAEGDNAVADESLFSGATIDFARLESDQQRVLMQRVKTEASLRDSLRELNPLVGTILGDEPRQASAQNGNDALERNCRVIAENYSPQVIGRQLHGIYQSLLASQPSRVVRDAAIARSVLESFVHPTQLFPLRLEL